MCCNAAHAQEYITQRDLPDARVVKAAQMWRLALTWYGDRLDRNYEPQTTEQRQRQLAGVGLTGEFWQLP
jgi:hypothetical protein